MISKNPFLQLAIKSPSYRNNLLINRSNVTVQIITTAVLFFFILIQFDFLNFDSICNIIIYFLLVLKFCNCNLCFVNKWLLKKKKEQVRKLICGFSWDKNSFRRFDRFLYIFIDVCLKSKIFIND